MKYLSLDIKQLSNNLVMIVLHIHELFATERQTTNNQSILMIVLNMHEIFVFGR